MGLVLRFYFRNPKSRQHSSINAAMIEEVGVQFPPHSCRFLNTAVDLLKNAVNTIALDLMV